ncbi:arginine deiminase-related protein [Aeromicrobium halocynthiae]|uniref:Arginine deiminase-related protein n=1 Tax=Aeromicrobium halocynthiae TaxID=560557 RepID=A0ABN2VW09_9ACTN
MTILENPTGPLPRTRPVIEPVRSARTRAYGMCTPEHFEVAYAINAWMDPSVPVDRARAMRQWQELHRTHLDLGHRIELLAPLPGLPDMVFAANGAVVVGGRAYGARFRHDERRPEAQAHAAWLRAHGISVHTPEHVNEGEGDFLVLRDVILAGTGFRTSVAAHEEAARVLGRRVVSLELVDPRFYHLDVALGILDDGGGDAPADIAYVPEAFSASSRAVLDDLFPGALHCSVEDALAFGLNLVSDGRNVVLPSAATRLAQEIAARGYTPVPVDLSEFVKAGGSVKCCTMEWHA